MPFSKITISINRGYNLLGLTGKTSISSLQMLQIHLVLSLMRLFFSLSNAVAGDFLTELIRNIYSNNFISFLTEDGFSPLVNASLGVKKGCPLSGLLFSIVIDYVMRDIPSSKFHVLAYVAVTATPH